MNLAGLEGLFWRSLRGELTPDIDREFVPCPTLTARERIAIYKRMYWFRQVNALHDGFPKLARALSDERFNDLACRYIQRQPSTHFALERLGSSFADFLSEGPEPRYADLAALEWARSEAFLAPNATDRALPTDVDPERFAHAKLEFVEALSVCELSAHALRLWEKPEEQLPREDDAPRVVVAVWRRGFDVMHTALGPEEGPALLFAWLGLPMGQACSAFELGPDVVERALEALSRWFRRGWVARVSYPDG